MNIGACLVCTVCAAFLLPLPARARDKVDVIRLKNGDNVTGEIQLLEYGQLSVSTDSMSTVEIRWPDVTAVHSRQTFIVEDNAGGRYVGTLSTDNQRRISVGDAAGARIEILSVTRIAPGEATFWNRLQGSFSLGVDYAKASDIATVSTSSQLNYRAPANGWTLSFDANSTKDPSQGTLDRSTLNYQYQWHRPQRRFWFGLTSLERNEETGIEARFLLGGGIGKYFLQTARSELSGLIGVVGVEEWATGEQDSAGSAETLLGGSYRIFKFSSPKVSLNSNALLFKSITESGRYRTNLNLTLRQEIVKDFYLDLSVYQSYDSDPPDVSADQDDYGVTTSLGYSFD